MERSGESQTKVDQATASLVIYQYEACPFCVKVRRALKRMNLHIELRDAKNQKFKEELIKGGGKNQVPCLRIPKGNGDFQWLYESNDIISYLKSNYAPELA